MTDTTIGELAESCTNIPVITEDALSNLDQDGLHTLLQESALDEQNGPVVHQQSGLRLSDVIGYAEDGEWGLGEMAKYLYKGTLAFDPGIHDWRIIKGSVWVPDEQHSSLAMVSEMRDLLRTCRYKHSKLLAKYGKETLEKAIKRLQTKAGIHNVRDLAKAGKNGLLVPGNQWDGESRYIGAPNGVIDLHTGELLEGDQNLFITKMVGAEYDPTASAPHKFIAALHTMFECVVPPPSPPCYKPKPKVDPGFDGLSIDGDGPTAAETLAAWETECEQLKAKYEADLKAHENIARKAVEDIITYLQRLFGYSLLGLCREHIFIVFYGPKGRNGKGILVRTISRIFNDYGGEIRPELLIKQRSGSASSPSPEIVDLKAMRYLAASETNQGEVVNTGVVKRLTGGDMMVGRPLYGVVVRFRPEFTLYLQTNYLPNAPSEDIAFWRRIKIIPFNRSFVDNPDPSNPLEAPIDKDLEAALWEERNQILKWVVDGAMQYLAHGLEEPSFIKAYVAECRGDRDILGEFINDYCDVDNSMSTPSTKFYEAFNSWLRSIGAKTWSPAAIAEQLGRKGFPKKKSNTMCFVGLDVKFTGDDFRSTP